MFAIINDIFAVCQLCVGMIGYFNFDISYVVRENRIVSKCRESQGRFIKDRIKMFRHTNVSNCSQSFDMGTEVRLTNRKLHCYEMLSLQYLQSHEIDLWLELCRYLMGTPVTERKAISKQSNDTEDDQEDHEVEVISEEPEGQPQMME